MTVVEVKGYGDLRELEIGDEVHFAHPSKPETVSVANLRAPFREGDENVCVSCKGVHGHVAVKALVPPEK